MFKGKAKQFVQDNFANATVKLADAVAAPLYEKLTNAAEKLNDAKDKAYTKVKEELSPWTQAIKDAAAEKAAAQVFRIVRPVVTEATKPPFVPDSILCGSIQVARPTSGP